MALQTILVAAAVLAAIVFLLRAFFLRSSNTKTSCSDCGSCPFASRCGSGSGITGSTGQGGLTRASGKAERP
ncbi:FeoB-associated Cys-rich membrane protein [Candidatus Fermentibacterales bacterium]|nr:FeoB-associated Cys-rich membrane protein [Candidatus Fermentibacterales bacterium]